MRTVPLLMALMVGISSAAMQQRPSPVYQPQVTSTGSTTPSMNGPPMKSTSALTSLMTPAPPNPALPSQPVAQARESIASEASMIQPTAVNPSTPSQNYYVYYYPHNQGGATVRHPDNSSIWSWTGWHDVAAGVGSLALVVVGGGILYNRYGSEVKTRALRELKDLNLSSDEASQLASKVFRAIEKFSRLNSDSE